MSLPTRNPTHKILVINADDLAFTPDINAAIETLHRAGRVTNASLMVDGAHVNDALNVIRRNPRLGVGLHLDLCPVAGFYKMPYAQMRESLAQPAALARIAGEIERQIQRFKSLGLEFTHMDSHRHFHALPELFETVIQVAAGHGLRTIRLTKNWILPRTPSVFWDDAFLAGEAKKLQQHGIMYPTNFVYGWKEYSAASFAPGLNELMVHVGFEDEHYLREYNLVSSDMFRRMLEEAGVQLTNYRDLVGNNQACTTQ